MPSLLPGSNIMNLVIPYLIRNAAEANIGAPCAPLDTGLRRYDG
ncbi:MAG TPA: hypothetical protein VFQ97_05435 [Gallionella sp.]|nr:hypothetical protein [Gallionella sp.]